MPLRLNVLRRMQNDEWVYTAYDGALTFEATTLYIKDQEYQDLRTKLREAEAARDAAIKEAEEYGHAVDQAQNERDTAVVRAERWEAEALRYAQNSGFWQEKYEELRKLLPSMVSAEAFLRYARKVWLVYGVTILSPSMKMKLIRRARKAGYRPLKDPDCEEVTNG